MRLLLSLLPVACLPQGDLSSYSSAWERQPAPGAADALPNAPGADRGPDGGGGSGPVLALDAGDTGGSAGSSSDAVDAGTERDASSEPPVIDAGPSSPAETDAGGLLADAAVP